MKKFTRLSLLVVLSVFLSLLILEGIYRWQVVDTYSPELRAFNPPEHLSDDERPTILIMGDSFTAGRTSYPGILQETTSHARVINAAVSGTGVIQTLIIAPERFQRFHPSIFIYQVYVGNDLFDITYPVNWSELPFLRNVYWLVTNHLRMIGYFNYRLAQHTPSPEATTSPTSIPKIGAVATSRMSDSFAVDKYDGRVKIYLKADPFLLEESILANGRRQADLHHAP